MTGIFSEKERRELAAQAQTLDERLSNVDKFDGDASGSGEQDLLEEWRSIFPDEQAFEWRLRQGNVSDAECRVTLEAETFAEGEPLPEWMTDSPRSLGTFNRARRRRSPARNGTVNERFRSFRQP